MKIELSNEDVELILRALGREKTQLNNGGFYHLAHRASDLQSKIKNGATK